MLRNYGQRDRYHHEVAGMNSRLDELQAALLISRLGWLDAQTDRRRAVANRYRSEIDNAAISLLDAPSEPTAHVHHLFVVLCAEREALQQHLHEHDVSSLVHYPVPAHRQAPYLSIQRDPEGLSKSEQFASECLSIPCHSGLRDDEVAQVIRAVNSFRNL